PGAEEDRVGEPFVGRAGQLLDAMLEGLGLSRQSVYIANVLKCRPPNNRDPSQNEASQCAPYLQRQIRLVAPSVILAVGRVAAQNLLGADGPLGRMRGQIHHYGVHEVPLVVTYHPAYLLRRPAEKAKAWRDLLLAAQVVSGNSR
ncbi:MAG: uracil-DNA glycosylase, partial [Chromatiales bacterium]|nr:uracil-DNA glycosylase [Chromatiales bacterium]